MRPRFHRHGGLLLALSLFVVTGCDNANDDNANNNPSNNQAQNNTEKPPEFNYIPLNDPDSVCHDAEASRPVFESLFDGTTRAVASNIEVCGESMVSACPACSPDDNAMFRFLSDLEKNSAVLQAFPVPSDCEDGEGLANCFFRRALAFPYRYAVASIDDVGGVIALTQAIKGPCGEGQCYTIQPQSLNKDCAVPQVQLFGVNTPSEGGFDFTTSPDLNSPSSFGFAVPLIPDLSELREIDDDRFAQAWIARQPHAPIEMFFPSVEGSVECADDDCAELTGCMRLIGYVDRCAVSPLVKDISVTDPYVEASPPATGPSSCEVDEDGEPARAKYIKTVLNFELVGGEVVFMGGAR